MLITIVPTGVRTQAANSEIRHSKKQAHSARLYKGLSTMLCHTMAHELWLQMTGYVHYRTETVLSIIKTIVFTGQLYRT